MYREVYDLLASKTRKGEPLRIRENVEGVYIEGLNKKKVTIVEEVNTTNDSLLLH